MGTYSNLTRIQKCNRDLRSSSHDMKTSRDDDFSQMLSKDAHIEIQSRSARLTGIPFLGGLLLLEP